MPDPERARLAPVVVVTGAMAPYTHTLYEALAAGLDRPLHVLACSARETARLWSLDAPRGYGLTVLPGLRWHRSAVTNHYANPAVVPRLLALAPAALVLNDFSPTMLMAAACARLARVPYGLRTDGVPETDPGARGGPRRLLRRLLARGAAFGLGPSEGSRALLAACGLDAPFGLTPLFPAWRPLGAPSPAASRPYDLLFCGALNEEVKGAGFFTEVVVRCAARGRPLRVRVVGEGPLRAAMTERFAAAGVPARFDGFLQQGALAEAYGSARLFHFPSRGDVWGIVVQEALQSGTAVIASPHAGASREVLAARNCGLVLPLDPEPWVAATLALLDDPREQDRLREAGLAAVETLSPERAVVAYLERLAPLLAGRERGAGRYGPKITSSV